MGEQLLALRQLHDLALVNDGDPVADEADHRKVVGDEQVGQIPLLLQLGQQVQHLGADGNVQRGDRLVCDDEVRFHDQRPGNADALTLTAGELVGEAAGKFRKQTHVGQGACHFGLTFAFGQVMPARVKAFADNIIHLRPFIQGGHGILEDHLDTPGDLSVKRLGDAPVDLLAVEEDFAPGSGVNADDGAADGGLSGAGFAHQTEGLTLINMEGYVIHRGKGVPPGTKPDDKILNLDQLLSVFSQRGSLPSPAECGHAPAAPPWERGDPSAMCGHSG